MKEHKTTPIIQIKALLKKIAPAWAKQLLWSFRLKLQALKPPHEFHFSKPSFTTPSPFPFMVLKDEFLEALEKKYQPTKRLHNYLVYYWMHFRDIRLKIRTVFEIGVESGRSLQFWEEFFPNAKIYGVDINPDCKQFEGGRRKIFIGDQGDSEFLNNVIHQIGESLDIIIDDGSHYVEHQLKSFEFFFPTMSEHGIYVVEDTGGVVCDYQLRTINSLKALVDNIMYWPKGFKSEDWKHLAHFPEQSDWINKNIIGIAFYRWIVFIMRGRNPEDNPFLTPFSSGENFQTSSK